MAAGLAPRNMRQFKAEMAKVNAARIKAGETAVRVEAYRLRKVLAVELRRGAPGGRAVEPLRVISRSGGRMRKPLAALAGAVRYWHRKDGTGSVFSVGFNGGAVVGQSGETRAKNQLSKSWIKIATAQQEGGAFPADGKRKHWIRLGGQLKKQRKRNARYFFLRKSTSRLTLPKRPIIAPFWAAHQVVAGKNIINNFQRKLAGERI